MKLTLYGYFMKILVFDLSASKHLLAEQFLKGVKSTLLHVKIAIIPSIKTSLMVELKSKRYGENKKKRL